MSIDEAMDWFQEIVTQVFDKKKLWGTEVFKAANMENVIGRMSFKYAGSTTAPMVNLRASGEECKTSVPISRTAE